MRCLFLPVTADVLALVWIMVVIDSTMYLHKEELLGKGSPKAHHLKWFSIILLRVSVPFLAGGESSCPPIQGVQLIVACLLDRLLPSIHRLLATAWMCSCRVCTLNGNVVIIVWARVYVYVLPFTSCTLKWGDPLPKYFFLHLMTLYPLPLYSIGARSCHHIVLCRTPQHEEDKWSVHARVLASGAVPRGTGPPHWLRPLGPQRWHRHWVCQCCSCHWTRRCDHCAF